MCTYRLQNCTSNMYIIKKSDPLTSIANKRDGCFLKLGFYMTISALYNVLWKTEALHNF